MSADPDQLNKTARSVLANYVDVIELVEPVTVPRVVVGVREVLQDTLCLCHRGGGQAVQGRAYCLVQAQQLGK